MVEIQAMKAKGDSVSAPIGRPAPDSPRKAAFRAVNEVVKALDANTDPASVGQADIDYLIFRAANAPGSEFRNRMRTIAALAVLGMEYFDGGYVRYEGHISQDPELELLRDAFPDVPVEVLHERRGEFLLVLRQPRRPPQSEPAPEPEPLRVFEPEPTPPARQPWEPCIIQFGPGN